MSYKMKILFILITYLITLSLCSTNPFDIEENIKTDKDLDKSINFYNNILLNTIVPALMKRREAYNSTDDEDHPCEHRTAMIVSYLLNESVIPAEYSEVYKFAVNSGTAINDFGDYYACRKMNISTYHKIEYKFPEGGNLGKDLTISLGLCYFKECDTKYLSMAKNDIAGLIKQFTGKDIVPDNIEFINTSEFVSKFRDTTFIGAVIVVVIFCILIILNILFCVLKSPPPRKATLLNEPGDDIKLMTKGLITHRNPHPTGFRKFLQHFDIFTHVDKLFGVHNGSKTLEHLRVFDGVRFLSMCWIVYGHTIFMPGIPGLVKNPLDAKPLSKTLKWTFLSAAIYAVDVFFYMSGFMLYFTLQKYFNKDIHRIKLFLLAVIGRYLRLFPLLLFCLLGLYYIMPYLGNGPMFNLIEKINKSCPTTFWTNLLYINNFYDYKPDQMCLGHTWYLANDMQFFIVSIIIFFFLNNNKAIRNIIFFLMLIGSLICSWVLCDYYKFRFQDIVHIDESQINFNRDYYIKPWNRIGAYILGLFFCELFLETEQYKIDYHKTENKSNNLATKINNLLIRSTLASLVVLVFSLLLIGYSVFIHMLPNNVDLPQVWHSFFHTFNKIFFVFGLGCIIHLTFLGRFAIIKEILSVKVFSIFSRVTYGAYLVHIPIIYLFFFSYDNIFYLKLGDFFFMSIGFIVFSIVASLGLTLLLESPVISLTKKMLDSDKETRKLEQTNEKL